VLSPQLTSSRRGFTLVELLVTMALIALVFGITAPMAGGWLRAQRLQDAVEELRTNWIKARTLAMDEGRPYRFQILTSGLGYRLAPNELAFWPDRSQSINAPVYGEEEDTGAWVLEQPLSEGLHFEAVPDDMVGLSGSNMEATWLFMPDGTARLLDQDGREHQQAGILLVTQESKIRQLQMRALTAHSQTVTP
jgi:prepilin-type N-terminal cleavage/methylation domain-containing protein